MFSKAVAGGLFSVVVMLSFVPASDAALWELVIDMNMEEAVVHSGETIVVAGRVVDHAYDPIGEAQVLVRIGAETARVITNPEGEFRVMFESFERVPGTYVVNVIATSEAKTGLASTQFELKGDISPISGLQAKLSTEEARKYLSANESDFEKDPIGQTLFGYYQGLLEELILEKRDLSKMTEEELHAERQRIVAEQLREEVVDRFQLGTGVYGGPQYDNYVKSLNPEVRDLIVDQLNFTKNSFEEAQKIRDEILANGGTYEEARQAYLDMLSFPKEVLEQISQQAQEDAE